MSFSFVHCCDAFCLVCWRENKPSPVLFHHLGFCFFFLFLIGSGIFLSEMNASFSLPQVPLVEPGAVLASLMELDLAGMLCAIKELPFPLSSFLFSAAETMTLACLYCLAREAWKFLCIFVDENLCKKKKNNFMIFGNFVERKECFAIISSFKGKSGFLTRRAARSISTFSWPWSCAGFLLCTPRLQFQSLWGLIGFWNH